MQRGAATIAKAAMHAPSLSEDRIFAGGRGRQDRVTSSTGFPGMKGFELAASVRSRGMDCPSHGWRDHPRVHKLVLGNKAE